MFNTRRVSIVRGEGGWKFFENLIGVGGLLKGEGGSDFVQKFKNLGNGRCVGKNFCVEVMKTTLF